VNKESSETSKSEQEGELDKDQVLALVARARNGDQEAFVELVMAYQQRVYSVIVQVVNNTEDAKELTQQTWLKAWNKLDTFKGTSGFFTWVYRIAHFTALDLLRKRARRKEDELIDGYEAPREPAANLAASSNPRPDALLERAEVREAFEAALEDLSSEHRTALVLRVVEGLSYEEIAKTMKCRKGTVMSRIYYARKNVQERLREIL